MNVTCEANAAAAAALAATHGKSVSVKESRQMLADMRKAWQSASSPGAMPFAFSGRPRSLPFSVEEFALAFVLAHHSRRLAKGIK